MKPFYRREINRSKINKNQKSFKDAHSGPVNQWIQMSLQKLFLEIYEKIGERKNIF